MRSGRAAGWRMVKRGRSGEASVRVSYDKAIKWRPVMRRSPRASAAVGDAISFGPEPPTLGDVARHGADAFDDGQKRELAESYMGSMPGADVPSTSEGKEALDDDGIGTVGDEDRSRNRAKRVLLDLMQSGEDFEKVLARYKQAGVVDEMLCVVTSARLRTAKADKDEDLEGLLSLILVRLIREIAAKHSSAGMRLIDELLQDRFMRDDEATRFFIEKRLNIGSQMRGVDVIGMAMKLRGSPSAAGPGETDGGGDANGNEDEIVTVKDFIGSIDNLLNSAEEEGADYRKKHAETLERLAQMKTWTLEALRGEARAGGV